MDQLQIIVEALERIEQRLFDAPTVQEIADHSPLSPWHFQRVFRAQVGETVGGYIRRRRLSRSIEALLESDARILEIALDHGFDSQEAYTRAFRAQFGLPPGRFRARGQRPQPSTLTQLTAERLRHAEALKRIEPRFVELDRTRYVGLGRRFISALAADTDNQEVLPELWTRLRKRRAEIPSVLGEESYGITCLLPDAERRRPDELRYLAGARVSSASQLPREMELRELQPCLYAVFAHEAPQALIPETIVHALLSWLPHSEFVFAAGAEIERVEASGKRAEFWLPVQRKSSA